MPTKNAINTNAPIEVAAGGTGASTLTDGGVLLGSGTGAITAASVGNTGTLMVGTTGADASMSTSSDGNFTFTGSLSGSERILTVENTSNTADSGSKFHITVGGDSAKDPYLQFMITGVKTWEIGIDNDDSDKLKIGDGGSVGVEEYFTYTTSGEAIKASQPAFLAYNSVTDTNVTGVSDATIGCDTEVFDQNSDYNNGTFTFTAPVTGRYRFVCGIRLLGITAANRAFMKLNTSNRNYLFDSKSPLDVVTASGDIGFCGSVFADMDAADTAVLTLSCSGEAGNTADIYGGASPVTFFGGYLAC